MTDSHTPPHASTSSFDAVANTYEAELGRGLRWTGEDSGYFAHTRVGWTRSKIQGLLPPHPNLLDFGCGTGGSIGPLLSAFDPQSLVGLDVSAESLEVLRRKHSDPRVSTAVVANFHASATVDLAFTNGVFHHIPPPERPAALAIVKAGLKPGALFAFWENNGANPLTRFLMSRVSFDADAVVLTAPEARQLLSTAGFEILRTDYLFIFPRLLAWLRPLEAGMSRAPLGAQFLVVARKPAQD